MDTCRVEIGVGLGQTAGKALRVGLMGRNVQPACLDLLIGVFKDGLRQQNCKPAADVKLPSP